MANSVLKTKYLPLYISVLVTAIVMALLFLRPDPALGIFVETDIPLNEINNEPGFRAGTTIVLNARIQLEGGLENIESANLVLAGGDPSLKEGNILDIDVELPIFEVLGHEVILNEGLGTLFVDVTYTDVTITPPANGYAYGYQGSGQIGGVISYQLTWTTPTGPEHQGIWDFYVAVRTTNRQGPNADSAKFVLVGPQDPLSVSILPISLRDPVAKSMWLMQLSLTGNAKKTVHKATVSSASASASVSVLSHSRREMIKSGDFHPAILEKWDISPEADLLLPFRFPDVDANNTTLLLTIEIEDIAGQTLTLDPIEVTISDQRSSFDLYLMPGFNFVTPALQCVNSTCSGDEYNIAALLAAQTVSRDKLNPAFWAEIPAVTGDVPLDKIVETVFAWDPVSDTFPAYTTSPSANTLLTMKAGNGYIIKSASINGVEPFKVFTGDFPQFDAGTEVPVPIRLTFEGTVIIDPGQSLPIYPVEPVWNLVGPHAERDTSVGVFLSPVSFPARTWLALFEFRNTLEFSFDDDGDVRRLPGGEVELLFVNRFNTLLGPDFGPQPAGDVVRAGSALWLLMCDGPVAECGGGLPPVLE